MGMRLYTLNQPTKRRLFPSLRLDAALGGGRPALPVPVPFTQSRVSSGGVRRRPRWRWYLFFVLLIGVAAWGRLTFAGTLLPREVDRPLEVQKWRDRCQRVLLIRWSPTE